jgi:hypothetical protein
VPDVEGYLVAALHSLRLAVQALDDAIDEGHPEPLRAETLDVIAASVPLFSWCVEHTEVAGA